jgi:hypothetical protein
MVYTDSLTKQFWMDNRDLCNKYFDYLVNKMISSNDSLITLLRYDYLVMFINFNLI